MQWAMLLCAVLTGVDDGWDGSVLSAQEKRDGWILLFDGKTAFGWSTEGDVVIEKGKFVFGKFGAVTCTSPLPTDCELNVWGYSLDILLDGEKKTSTESKPFRTTISAKNLGRLKISNGYGLEVKLRPTDMKLIFNGKDLDGWTVFPGKKSKFEAKDGEIQLHDGPGDLQTTAKYRNFILQLECKSNGKHLNSGVFFRCRANEYQNGYECQIQNGFAKEKEYTVETFDPMSHKLLDKKKVMSGAIDYGTGAIYRRVPARSEVAKDHEWFTMTVLAVDNRFATWVDGIQQVDWTDNRLPNDNARNGYRSRKRATSACKDTIRTTKTNLSFRNIRIQELP